ncbi:hypothetical protein VPMS16_3516 [Vibrio sp. 16]|nr:hypothetical protein VPMS16_3516 [Vibrio sp. 16]
MAIVFAIGRETHEFSPLELPALVSVNKATKALMSSGSILF